VIATISEMAGPGLCFDTAFHLDPAGGMAFRYRKVHPAAVPGLETLCFRSGTRCDIRRCGAWRAGIGICYDLAFSPRSRRNGAAGPDRLPLAP
jgi:N-carbamoylputrescine amidase